MTTKITTTSPEAPRGVTAAMAARYGMEVAHFQSTLAETILPSKGKGANPAQVAAFLLVAQEYHLNPFTREIYAFPDRGGGIVPVVGVDGWVTLVNSQPQMDGMEFTVVDSDDGAPYSCTCSIWRKDRSRPVTVTEYYGECRRSTDPWKGMPRRMLRHKALIQCARIAFGFSGIYDEDEALDIATAEHEVKGSRPLADFAPAPDRVAVTTDPTVECDVCGELGHTGADCPAVAAPESTGGDE